MLKYSVLKMRNKTSASIYFKELGSVLERCWQVHKKVSLSSPNEAKFSCQVNRVESAFYR